MVLVIKISISHSSVNTRGDLRPDPKVDEITSIIYCIRDDDAIERAGLSYKYTNSLEY